MNDHIQFPPKVAGLQRCTVVTYFCCSIRSRSSSACLLSSPSLLRRSSSSSLRLSSSCLCRSLSSSSCRWRSSSSFLSTHSEGFLMDPVLFVFYIAAEDASYLFLSCSSRSILCEVTKGAKRLQHLLSSLINSTIASSFSMFPKDAHSFLHTEQTRSMKMANLENKSSENMSRIPTTHPISTLL